MQTVFDRGNHEYEFVAQRHDGNAIYEDVRDGSRVVCRPEEMSRTPIRRPLEGWPLPPQLLKIELAVEAYPTHHDDILEPLDPNMTVQELKIRSESRAAKGNMFQFGVPGGAGTPRRYFGGI